jgi:hypothetical protein
VLTVEVGLRKSNPIDPVLTVYRIQKQSNRNLGEAADAVACGSIRWCLLGVAALGLARDHSARLSRQIAVSWTEGGHHPLPRRAWQARGQRPPATAAVPGISRRHREYIY